MDETPNYLKSMKRDSVVQSVIDRLTDAIRNRELKPGDRIPSEPELASSLGIARSSLREAIKILTYLGVLESRRSEGTFVCAGFKESMIDPMVYGILLNQDSFENLMELREMTEAGMMRLAILKGTGGEISVLEGYVEEMAASLELGEQAVEEFFRVDNQFHDAIAHMGRNPLAEKINRVVRTLTYAMRHETVSAMILSGRGEELVAAHRELCETLRSKDLSRLDSVVRESYFGEVLEHAEPASS